LWVALLMLFFGFWARSCRERGRGRGVVGFKDSVLFPCFKMASEVTIALERFGV
jgi:hypothetical protein